MPATGDSIGAYTLGRPLGQGAFGAVFAATHLTTGQQVAIKLLHKDRPVEPEVQNRFVREIALLKRLDDPHIVQHLDCGLHDGALYCVMELVECGSLKEVLAERRNLPWRDAVEVARQTALGLNHAHELGCVHRDLKPSNLYLSIAGQVKIGDLGLARDLTNSRLTVQGQTVGTWRYMPPEQITGADDIDGRLDLYALGCILFEMLAGRVPFEGASHAEIFDKHLETVPVRVDSLAPWTPAPLADLVAQLLEKDPADRPATGADLAAQLGDFLAGIDRVPTDADAPGASAAPSNLTERLRGPAADRSGPDMRVLAALGGVAAVAAIAWFAWKFTR